MAYYFRYSCPEGTGEDNIPRTKGTCTFYFNKTTLPAIGDYVMEYTGEDPLVLKTLREDSLSDELTPEAYAMAISSVDYQRSKAKGE
jgi:hypothetical protein